MNEAILGAGAAVATLVGAMIVGVPRKDTDKKDKPDKKDGKHRR